jgi:ubiquinone/menaquinone biosynthesis C-methylase UbiE
MPTLTHDAARALYDCIGPRQDAQGWYEDAPLERLIEEAQLARARSIVELGCGTGRLAERLLAEVAPAPARYLGLDLSPVMVALARERLERFGARAEVRQSDGRMLLPLGVASADRVLATYVLDLLSFPDIGAFLVEAHRVLKPGGLLCVAGLTCGERPLSRAVSALWSAVHRIAPAKLGGCRPLMLQPLLDRGRWRLVHRSVVSPFGFASEVIVAERS